MKVKIIFKNIKKTHGKEGEGYEASLWVNDEKLGLLVDYADDSLTPSFYPSEKYKGDVSHHKLKELAEKIGDEFTGIDFFLDRFLRYKFIKKNLKKMPENSFIAFWSGDGGENFTISTFSNKEYNNVLKTFSGNRFFKIFKTEEDIENLITFEI